MTRRGEKREREREGVRSRAPDVKSGSGKKRRRAREKTREDGWLSKERNGERR